MWVSLKSYNNYYNPNYSLNLSMLDIIIFKDLRLYYMF